MGAAGGRRTERRDSAQSTDELPKSIDRLPSGALRVRVYGGSDPITGRRIELRETIPAGTPDQVEVAKRTRDELLMLAGMGSDVNIDPTVSQMLRRFQYEWTKAAKTRNDRWKLLRNHIEPLIGTTKARRLDDEHLDAFYRELARCRRHCTSAGLIDHRTTRAHECDDRCRPHRCQGLGKSAIRQIHFFISATFTRAITKWKWPLINPCLRAEPPAAGKPDPRPPTPTQMADIINEAWAVDVDWGTRLWLTATTGVRRGENCALRWTDFTLDSEGDEGVAITRGISEQDRRDLHGEPLDLGEESVWVEGPTKTGQHRRIALDPETAQIMREYRDRCWAHAAELGVTIADDAFVFSPVPDHSTFYVPDTFTRRFQRLVDVLAIDAHLHCLRQYHVTELIRANVDIRTVAGRIGHGSGGATTLRYYAAFKSEADQRAAGLGAVRMPAVQVREPIVVRRPSRPLKPYEQVAFALHDQMLAGQIAHRDRVPAMRKLAADHGVSVGTAHRACDLLRSWGHLTGGGKGGRPNSFLTTAAVHADVPAAEPVSQKQAGESAAVVPEPRRHEETEHTSTASGTADELDLEIVRLGHSIRTVRTVADPHNTQHMLQLLNDSVRRSGGDLAEIGDYEMVVRYAGERGSITTFVAPPRSNGRADLVAVG